MTWLVIGKTKRTDYEEKLPLRGRDTIVLGPEIFASKDGSVICWKGENFYNEDGWWEHFGEQVGDQIRLRNEEMNG